MFQYIVSRAIEISSLSEYDFICLVATYNNLLDRSKNKVSTELELRGYSPEALAQANKHISEKFNSLISCGLRFTKPFDHLQFGPISYALTLFENYKRGCLPFPGSVSEQPAQIMEVFSVLEQLSHEAEVRMREKSKSNGRNQHQNFTRTRR